MTNFFTKIILNLLFLFLVSAPLFAQEGNEIAGDDKNSPKESSVLKIDGKITDNEWKGSKVFTDFYMMIPKSDKKDYDSTIAYIKQDKDAIYIAIKYWPRGKIIKQSLTRDRSTDEENEFFILLDLENKNKNGYVFVVSFLNNQRDAIVYNQTNQSYEWDWQWENKVTIFKEAKNGQPGYAEMEIKIPVDRLQNKNKKQIGVDLQLFSYTPDGNYTWYALTPNSELLNLKSMYKMDLTTPFDEKLNLRFNLTPFIVGRSFNSDTARLRFGGEFAISLDKHKLKSTIFTDESTLEADPFRFAFYGRPIFLQEKRPFFSKDLDIYRTPVNLFYSRAIDKIQYGFNYTYRSDKFKMGALYVQDTLPTAPNSTRRFAVVRPNFNFPDFNIGGLFMYNTNELDTSKEQMISVDSKINLPSRFRLITQLARSFRSYDNKTINSERSNSGNMYNAYLYFEQNSNGGPYMDAGYTRYDSNFSATTLFNNYGNNYDEINVSGGYQFVNNNKYFSNINLSAGYYRSHEFSEGFNYQNGVFGNMFYKVTGWLSFFHSLNFDRPNDRDDNGGIITQNNILTEHNFKVVFGNNSFSAGFYGGRYFGDKLLNPYASVDLAFFGKVRLGANYNYIKQGEDFEQSIYNIKLDYKVMDKLFLRAYYQRDTFRKRALLNTMLQYEFFGGSSVYLVLNLDGDRLEYTRRYFKVSYEFNF
ncbi:MAG: hypothetical protein HOP31_03955 [Ignavibacteria bacterium]|nr:hypothetical protein [Ignavibacteria bacterium]